VPIERETIVERPASSETVVVGGNSAGVIGGIIAALLVVGLLIWLFAGGISTDGGAVNVDLPEVTVSQ